jgi:DnaJ-domain-containing protein 1
MLDYFDLLQTPRQPWLDLDLLKQKFFTLSTPLHPDRAHNASAEEKIDANQRFSERNVAWLCLRDPKERLAHLLELETGARPGDTQNVPAPAVEFFIAMARLVREVDAFLVAKEKNTSPLLQVESFGQRLQLTERLQELQQRLNTQRDGLLGELQKMNAAWETAPPLGSPERPTALPLAALEDVYRFFSYITRWTGQIQERVGKLSF